MEYPFVDLPTDIIAWTNVNEEILKLYKQSCKLKAFILALCAEGSIKVSVNLMNYEIRKGQLVTLLPGSIIQFYHQNDKVNLSFVGFSEHCINGTNYLQSISSTYTDILESPIIEIDEAPKEYLSDYLRLLEKLTTRDFEPDTRLATHIFNTILDSIDTLYKKRQNNADKKKNRKEELCLELVQLIIDNYMKERGAQFYADKLGVSLQYLSNTVKEVTGKSILDLISNAVITDITAKLKSTDMSIKEIAYSLNFPNTSFFGKYFKRHVGMTPLEYRKK